VAPATAAAVPPKLCLSTSNFCSRFAIPLSAVLLGLGLVALTTVRLDEQTGVAKIRIIDDLCPRWLDAVEQPRGRTGAGGRRRGFPASEQI
jgi:hypothetical protein